MFHELITCFRDAGRFIGWSRSRKAVDGVSPHRHGHTAGVILWSSKHTSRASWLSHRFHRWIRASETKTCRLSTNVSTADACAQGPGFVLFDVYRAASRLTSRGRPKPALHPPQAEAYFKAKVDDQLKAHSAAAKHDLVCFLLIGGET